MTEEQLLKRIEILKSAQEKIVARAQAVYGQIQECEHWLVVIKGQDADKEKSPPVK